MGKLWEGREYANFTLALGGHGLVFEQEGRSFLEGWSLGLFVEVS